MVIADRDKDCMLSFHKFWEQEISGGYGLRKKDCFNVKELFTLIKHKPDYYYNNISPKQLPVWHVN